MTYYGIEFISEDEWRENFVSTKLFQKKETAIAYAKYWVREGGWETYKVHTFQVQQEHIQD